MLTAHLFLLPFIYNCMNIFWQSAAIIMTYSAKRKKIWLHKFGNIEEMTISLLKLTPEIKCKICSEHFTWLCFSDSVRNFSSILSILFHIVDWNFSLRLLTLPFWFINTKIVHWRSILQCFLTTCLLKSTILKTDSYEFSKNQKDYGWLPTISGYRTKKFWFL